MGQVLDHPETHRNNASPRDQKLDNALTFLIQCLDAVRNGKDIPDKLPGISVADRIKVRLATRETAEGCWLRELRDDETCPAASSTTPAASTARSATARSWKGSTGRRN